MAVTLLTGGARAGKSSLAVHLASRQPVPVFVVATAEARDAHMADRIRRHRRARPPSWGTVEEPLELEAALASIPPETCVIVDCLTMWVSNVIEAGLDDVAIAEHAGRAAQIASLRTPPLYVVTNEVGAGLVPGNPLGRRFRDTLGGINAVWSGVATSAYLVVAGRALSLARAEEIE